MFRKSLIAAIVVLAFPAAAQANLLWKADATQSIDKEWASFHTTAHCAVVTAPGVTDPRLYQIADSTAPHGRAYQADYIPSSVTGCYCYPKVCREEVGQSNPGKTFADRIDRLWHNGQSVWISFEVKLGANFNGGIGGTGATIIQFTHPVGSGAPPWGLSAGGPGPGGSTNWNFWGITAASSNASSDNYVGAFQPAVGRWVKFSVYIHMAQDSTGDFEAYSDFANPGGPMVHVFSAPNRFTMSPVKPAGTAAMLTMGNYVATSPQFQIHYAVAGLTVATDRASAEANAFGGSLPPPPPPPPPGGTTAAFSYSPASPVTGQQVQLDGTGSTCGAAPCSYTWTDDHAPGVTLGTGSTLAFTFHFVGTKHIRLTVKDANGGTATTEKNIAVAMGSASSFRWHPASPHVGQLVVFSAVNVTHCAARPCSFSWSDHRGKLGHHARLHIRFHHKGTAHIVLTVIDRAGLVIQSATNVDVD